MPLRKKLFITDGPRVHLLAASQVFEANFDEFLSAEGFEDWDTDTNEDGERLVEIAGRACYMSFAGGRSHGEYIQHIKESRHGSVLEHATITFLITGVSRSFSHELVRHRVGWSYSQLSQRYVDETNAQMVRPPLLDRVSLPADRDRVTLLWEQAVWVAHHAYEQLVGELEWQFCPPHGTGKADTGLRKAIRGTARSLLPNATETKLVATCNARSLRHFLELRTDPAADAEIRAVAMLMYRAALPIWPDILADYKVCRDPDGQEYLTTEYVKV